MLQGETKEIDYYFCIAGRQFSDKFLKSWTETVCMLIKNNKTFNYSIQYNPVISETRNSLVATFIDPKVNPMENFQLFGGIVKPKKIIFIDDDIIWKVTDIEKLINSDFDVVTGFYPKSDLKELACTINGQYLPINYLENKNRYIELQCSGLGFMCVSYEVLEKMTPPFFANGYQMTDKGLFSVGEDIYFSFNINNLGYKIYGDTTIRLNHLKSIELSI